MSTDRHAPGVRLTLLRDEKALSGQPLDLRVLSMTFEDCDDKADKLNLLLDNFDLSLFDREDLMAGAILEVAWGYPGNMSPPRRVVVRSMKGFQQLTLDGHALSALMNQQVKTRRWAGKSRSEVVREVAKEAGYEGALLDVEDTSHVLDVVNQAAETDARFLSRLAAKEGFQFFVDGIGLHWHRRRLDAAPHRVLTWYSDPAFGEILSVSVESDLVKRAGEITVKGRDPKAKSTFEATATASNAKRSTLSDLIEVVDPKTGDTTLLKRNATQNIASSPAPTSSRAAREAEARFVKAEREAVKLTLQVVGDPTLVAKSILEVRGISPLLSGKYYVKEVKHTVSSSGYVCDLKLCRDAKGRPVLGAHADATKSQTGDRNSSSSKQPGRKKEIETVNRETGQTQVEYRDDSGGSSDPEARTTARR